MRISNFNLNALVLMAFALLARLSNGKQTFKDDEKK